MLLDLRNNNFGEFPEIVLKLSSLKILILSGLKLDNFDKVSFFKQKKVKLYV